MNPLDALELDVGGGRRAGDERDRPSGLRGLGEPSDGVGHGGHDLLLADDAQVVVGHERQRPPARAPAAVEDDRAGLGDPERAARQHAVEGVEVSRRQQRLVAHELDARDVRRRLGRDREPRRTALAARIGERVGEPAARDAVDGRAVVRDALAEQLHVGGGGAGRAVVASRRRAARACRRAPRGCGRGSQPARRSRHQSRNVWSGMSGRSRIAVQPLSIGIAPSRCLSGPRPSLARRCARS